MKKFISLAFALLLLASLALPALAAEETVDLGTLQTDSHVYFCVTWDKEQPAVVFIAPNGTELDPAAKPAGTNTSIEGNTLYFEVKNAPAGQWYARYEKGANTEVKISVYRMGTALDIQSFTVTPPTLDTVEYEFTVSAARQIGYQYTVSVVVDGSSEEKRIAEGFANTGVKMSGSADLSFLATYDRYMLKLRVWYMDGGSEMFDTALSQEFAYVNTDIAGKAFDYAVTVQPDQQLLTLSWPGLGWDVEAVLVAVFEDDSAEPVLVDTYDPRAFSTVQLGYDPGCSKVSVEVTPSYNGVYARPVRKEMDIAGFWMSLPEQEAFNTTLIPLTYNSAVKHLITVNVNGYNTEMVLSGSGKVSIPVDDDWNDVSVHYQSGNNVSWLLTKKIFVDRIPPQLTMSQAYDGMSVEGSTVTISGMALDCQSLTINGQPVTLDQNQLFSLEVGLSEGGNTIRVVATDALGNASTYTALIYRGSDMAGWLESENNKQMPGGLLETLTGQGSYWILGIVSVLCVLVIVYAVLFWRKEDKK